MTTARHISKANTDYIIILILSLAVFMVCAFFAYGREGIYLSGDEFAQLSIAAYFNGYDLSEATSSVGYYSYGYALLIVPFFSLFNSTAGIYKAALFLNAFIAAAIVPLSYALCRQWGLKSVKDNKIIAPIVLFSVLTGAVAAYSALALAEVALIAVAFATVLLFYKIQDKECGYIPYAAQAFLLVYGYMLHQRFLGGLIAGIFVVFVLTLCRRIQIKKALVFFIAAALLMAVHSFIKSRLQSDLWLLAEGQALGNDTGQQLATLRDVLTDTAHFTAALRVAAGHFFYIAAASCGFIFFAVHKLTVSITGFLRNIKTGAAGFDFTLIYLFLGFLFTFAISVIFMHRIGLEPVDFRADRLLYGRYNTIFYPVLTQYICVLTAGGGYKASRTVLAAVIFIFACLAFGVHYLFSNWYGFNAYMDFNTVNLTVFRQYGGGMFIIYAFLFASAAVAAFVLISKTAPAAKKGGAVRPEPSRLPAGRALPLSVIMLICVTVSVGSASIFISKANADFITRISAGVNRFMKMAENNGLTVYCDDSIYNHYIATVFRIGAYDRNAGYIDPQADDDTALGDEFYLITRYRPGYEMLGRGRRHLLYTDKTLLAYDDTSGLYFYKCSKNAAQENTAGLLSFTLDLSGFSTQAHCGGFTDYGIASNGSGGFLMHGPYISVSPGSYEFTVSIESDTGQESFSTRESLGYIDMACEKGANVLGWRYITAEDFTDSRADITIPLIIDETLEDFELRVFVNEGVVLTITGVSVSIDGV